MKFLLLSLVVVLLHASCKNESEGSSEEKLILLARANSNKAIAGHDTTGIGKTLTADVHLITSRNGEAKGRKSNLELYAADFIAKKDVIYMRTPSNIKLFMPWNMASESGNWVGRWSSDTGPIEVGGTYFAKWHKVDGVWLIRAEIFATAFCKGDDFCNQSPI